jgi:hypothetical protein
VQEVGRDTASPAAAAVGDQECRRVLDGAALFQGNRRVSPPVEIGGIGVGEVEGGVEARGDELKHVHVGVSLHSEPHLSRAGEVHVAADEDHVLDLVGDDVAHQRGQLLRMARKAVLARPQHPTRSRVESAAPHGRDDRAGEDELRDVGVVQARREPSREVGQLASVHHPRGDRALRAPSPRAPARRPDIPHVAGGLGRRQQARGREGPRRRPPRGIASRWRSCRGVDELAAAKYPP